MDASIYRIRELRHAPHSVEARSGRPDPGAGGPDRGADRGYHFVDDADCRVGGEAQRRPHCACVLARPTNPRSMPTTHRVARRQPDRHPHQPPSRRLSLLAQAGHSAGAGKGSTWLAVRAGLCALIIHLHVTQAIRFERVVRPLAEVLGVDHQRGCDRQYPLARAEAPLLAAAAPTREAVWSASPVVGSDETSARVGGKNWWQWVLLDAQPRSAT